MKKQQVKELHTIDENELYNRPASPENKNLTKVLEKENNIPNDPLYFSPEKFLEQEKRWLKKENKNLKDLQMAGQDNFFTIKTTYNKNPHISHSRDKF